MDALGIFVLWGSSVTIWLFAMIACSILAQKRIRDITAILVTVLCFGVPVTVSVGMAIQR